jgi:hypothetical protein
MGNEVPHYLIFSFSFSFLLGSDILLISLTPNLYLSSRMRDQDSHPYKVEVLVNLELPVSGLKLRFFTPRNEEDMLITAPLYWFDL